MKRFLSQLLIFLSPLIVVFLAIVGLYFYLDPFKVLKKYPTYSSVHIIPNRDYVSTEVFNNRYKTQHYNSFIFGSSRSIAFKPSAWKSYLDSTAQPFSFDASGESIYGIYSKIKYLDSQGVDIKNALIVLCHDASFMHDKNHDGFLLIKHPSVSGESRFAFQKEFFEAYLSPEFLYKFYGYKIVGKYKPFMKGVVESRTISVDSITNEEIIVDQEQALKVNPAAYYESIKNMFYKRTKPNIDTAIQINDRHLFMLKEIKRIFDKHKTSYRIVISPLYEQVRFHPSDEFVLTNLFAPYIYDYSGKNHFTEPITNFYETSHYRPEVANNIMKMIYKGK